MKLPCPETMNAIMVQNQSFHSQVHRLVVVSDEDKVVGVVSLSDILSYLVLRIPSKGGHISLESSMYRLP